MSRLFRSTPEPYYATKSADAQELAKEVENIPVVTANPELAGTEANLTGLQVGNTKYAVSAGGGGSFLVTWTDVTDQGTTTWTADKTFKQIWDAMAEGKIVYNSITLHRSQEDLPDMLLPAIIFLSSIVASGETTEPSTSYVFELIIVGDSKTVAGNGTDYPTFSNGQ